MNTENVEWNGKETALQVKGDADFILKPEWDSAYIEVDGFTVYIRREGGMVKAAIYPCGREHEDLISEAVAFAPEEQEAADVE